MSIPKGKDSLFNQQMEIRRSEEFREYVFNACSKIKSHKRLAELAAKKFKIPVNREFIKKMFDTRFDEKEFVSCLAKKKKQNLDLIDFE